jgi:nitrogen fixation NifU-like protein
MSTELEELYQQVLLDHARRPRNFGEITGGAIHIDGDNPSCGDEIHLHVRFAPDGAVEEIKFTGKGCAISQASASMMTLKLKGKSAAEASSLAHAFHELITSESPAPERGLGDLQLLAGVRKFPQRAKCALLAWRAFEAAQAEANSGQAPRIVTTEAETDGAPGA